MTFFALLGAAVGPLARKVLFALGIGVVSYGAIDTLVDNVIVHIQTNYAGMSGAAVQLLNLAGAGEVLGILAGALTARVSFLTLQRFAKL